MRFAGGLHTAKVPNFYDRGVDFGSRHGVQMGALADQQAAAWNAEAMVHNAQTEADVTVGMAEFGIQGYGARESGTRNQSTANVFGKGGGQLAGVFGEKLVTGFS